MTGGISGKSNAFSTARTTFIALMYSSVMPKSNHESGSGGLRNTASNPNRSDQDDRLEIGEWRTKPSSILEVNGNRVRVLTDFLDVVLDEN
jgi:hypothetical protein